MSDYFGALMRSSGLAVGGAAPVLAAPPDSAAALIEIDIERSVPAMQPLPALAAQHQTRPLSPAMVSAEPQPGREPEAPAAPPTTPRVDATAAVDRSYDQAGRKEALPTSAQPPVPAASPTDHSTPAAQPLGHDVVRAVMHWVAADPQQAISVPRDETGREPLAVLDTTDKPIVRESRPALTPLADVAPHAVLPVQTQTPKSNVTHSATEEAMAKVPRRASQTATAMPTPGAPTPLPRDELVEISIGAIHLRVDAPPVQTLTRSPVPKAAAPRSSAPTTTPRSALARRALRRI